MVKILILLWLKFTTTNNQNHNKQPKSHQCTQMTLIQSKKKKKKKFNTISNENTIAIKFWYGFFT